MPVKIAVPLKKFVCKILKVSVLEQVKILYTNLANSISVDTAPSNI